ncbi:glycosyltransferase N-terminal domain-containing protein [uncultured Roseobacter sp.]|uniref:3-deoxy-D-manno-octulosonic acid transferase n=1 Tax=uncultured Roseobacter sp. TaxID=114847 RepID=UPI002639B12B|nr:glycosyltransferase N-terminal domain-containing protein [uncultured Roseobacter sp.]
MGADPTRFAERLGRSDLQCRESVVWFHAASLGEATQIASLVQHLIRSENVRVLVTTTTAAGADWVARKMPYVTHQFAPIDTPGATERFLNRWSISAAVFVEGDLWPQLLGGLDKRGIPRILLNARRSRTRERFPAVFAALLKPFALVTCRSDSIAEGMAALGLASDRIHVLPDLRLTLPKLTISDEALSLLSLAVEKRPVWLAASTHPADEEAVLTAHQEVLEAHPDTLLILAPRHLNRGLPLQKLAQSANLTAARRSLDEKVSAATQVYIADTLGELGIFFTLSPVTFLGGSFGQEGGHNPYEPVCFETALLYGPHVANFAEAYKALSRAGAAEKVGDPEHLGRTVVRLLRSDEARKIGQAGLAFWNDSQDCTVNYAELVAGVLKRPAA